MLPQPCVIILISEMMNYGDGGGRTLSTVWWRLQREEAEVEAGTKPFQSFFISSSGSSSETECGSRLVKLDNSFFLFCFQWVGKEEGVCVCLVFFYCCCIIY